MKVVDHPYLAGVKCREDGAVWIPQSGSNKAHWTFGYRNRSGYHQVSIAQRHRYVHRLICEAFHSLHPEGKPEVDHIDGNPCNNKPENLRWVTSSENCRNRSTCTKEMEGVISQTVDRNTYMRTYMRARRAKKKEVLNNQPKRKNHYGNKV